MSKEIIVSGALPRPEIAMSPAAFEARRMALSKTASIIEVYDAMSLDAAGEALQVVKGLLKAVEETRKEVKAPVLDVGKRIDECAKHFCGDLERESARLSSLVGSWLEAQKRKAEREREEAAKAQAEAIKKLHAEQDALAQAVKAGDLPAEQAVAAADAARAEAAEVIASSQLAVTAAVGAQAEGITSRGKWCFEVVDIRALLAARPELVTVAPNNAVIRAALKATGGAAIPGLRIWQDAVVSVRTAKAQAEDYDY